MTKNAIISRIEFLETQITEYTSLYSSSTDGNKRTLYKEVIIKNRTRVNQLRTLLKKKKKKTIKFKSKSKR